MTIIRPNFTCMREHSSMATVQSRTVKSRCWCSRLQQTDKFISTFLVRRQTAEYISFST